MALKRPITKSALLVIDIVNSCCHERCEIAKWGITFRKIRRMVPKLERFIEEYRSVGGNVVFVGCVPWRKEYLARNILELYKDPGCRYYTKDLTGFSEQFYQIKPARGDKVFLKNSYDAFTNYGLRRYLNKNGINKVVVTGIFGDGCVNATINGGFSAGYNLVMLKDLIETTDVPVRQRLQNMLKERNWPQMYGKTIESTEFWKMVE